jgi:hypothetical protein
MKKLFENWRKFLHEKKWQDYESEKNSWFDVPVEDIEAAARERGGEINIADELYNLIDKAYAQIGGHFDFSGPQDLPDDHNEWLASDIDNDPEPDVLRVSKKNNHGSKMTVGGHDGSRAAIDAYIAKTAELLKTDGYFSEMSKGIAHIMITRHNIPYVDNQEDVERVLGKPVQWLGDHPDGKYPGYDGWYVREIGGIHKDMKILLGKPK